jgi:hypothetical protein
MFNVKSKYFLLWSVCWTIISLYFIAHNARIYVETHSNISIFLCVLWMVSGYFNFRNARAYLELRRLEKDNTKT